MFGITTSSGASLSNKMVGLATLALAASTVNAHLFLQHPTPIEGPIKDPLDASGSNFPCHGATIPTSGGEKMAMGSSQELIFDNGDGANTAVHGGGSCQISITYETGAKLKDPSSWHVIHSMEGACPSGTTGNLDGQYTGPQGAYSGALQCSDPKANGVDCINSYNYTIPSGLQAGHATMAWTWFNKIGNREMYMNCWPAEITGAEITGGGNNKRDLSEFPTMFVANVASVTDQTTTEGEDQVFPNPGPSPDIGSGGSEGAAPSYGASAPATPPQSSAAPAQSSAPAAGGNGGAPKATVTTMETMASGYAAPTSASAPAVSSVPPSVAAPAPDSSSSGSSSSGSSSSGSSSSGSSSSGEGVACTEDGAVVCIGTTSFGLCNEGTAVAQPLAKGTKCSNGVISKRDHVRRHLGGHGRRF